jgi:hypothetical protein
MSTNPFRIPSFTAVVSLVFAVTGFSYNAWRLEQSEENNIVRDASFQVLTELAEFEQVIYINHYDGDSIAGSPRLGWVKIGLVNDLSMLIGENVSIESATLKNNWAENWPQVSDDMAVVDSLVVDIDDVRLAIQKRLAEMN